MNLDIIYLSAILFVMHILMTVFTSNIDMHLIIIFAFLLFFEQYLLINALPVFTHITTKCIQCGHNMFTSIH